MTGNRYRLGDCLFEGCPNPVLAKDMCQTHYHQNRRGVVLHASYVAPEGCLIEWCNAEHHSIGYCRPHYTSMRKFGIVIAPDAYCAVCGSQDRLVVDHDHSCCPDRQKTCGKCVRGVLCTHCNLAIGHADESAQRLLDLAEYLKVRV